MKATTLPMSYIRLRMRFAVALADKPDLIIMDVRLRSVFATACADEQTRARGSIACPVAWLEKPFGVESILQAVRLAFQDRVE